jgi:hypothetical protein
MADLARQAFGATGSTWTDSGFTASDFNSRANGSVVVAATAITNDNATTEGDTHIIVSGEFEVGGTTTANSRIDLYILPEGQGGEFGDNIATGTTVPARSYLVGQANVQTGITSTNLVFFTFPPIPIPMGDFKLAIAQHMGAALDSTAAAVVKHRTVLMNLNG